MPLAGREVLHRDDVPAGGLRADLEVAEVKPELPWFLRECDGYGYRRAVIGGFLDEPGHVRIVHGHEMEVCGLQKGRMRPPGAVDPADVVLDVARRIPVAHPDLVFFRIEILL